MASYTVTLRDGMKHVFEATSVARVDYEEFDGKTYRNILDASWNGRPSPTGILATFSQSFTGTPPLSSHTTENLTDTWNSEITTPTDVFYTHGGKKPGMEDEYFPKSDDVTGTPPWPEKKTNTYLVFYGPGGAPNDIVAEFPNRNVSGWSKEGEVAYV